MSDETARIRIEIAPLTPVAGRGAIRFTTTATLDIDGIVLTVHAVAIRAEPGGRLYATLPQTRAPGGTWTPALALPIELERAIATAALGLVDGARVMTLPLPNEAEA